MKFHNRQITLRKSRGVTLIELMVGLVIVAIGFTVAVPSFQGMLARNRVATQVNEMILSINLARSEASRTGASVSIQALDGSDTSNEFGPGWCVVFGSPGDCDGDPDAPIRFFDPLVGDSTLNLVAAGGATSILFTPLGALVNSTTVNLDLCYEGQTGRRIVISPTGRSKSTRVDPAPAC